MRLTEQLRGLLSPQAQNLGKKRRKTLTNGAKDISKELVMIKTISLNVKKMDDKDLIILWNKILTTSFMFNKEYGLGMSRKCMVDLIDEYPQIQKVDGVLNLLNILLADRVRQKKARLNKKTIIATNIQNKAMEELESTYQIENDETFNLSLNLI